MTTPSSKELARLRREIMATLRIRHPEVERSEVVGEFVAGTLASYARARVKEQECLRLTILAAQKFLINQFESTNAN